MSEIFKIILCFLFLSTCISCEKEQTITISNAPLIKKVINGSNICEYFYNNQRQLIVIKCPNGHHTNFTYSRDTVIRSYFNTSAFDTTIYILNKNGLVDSSYGILQGPNIKYIYNLKDELILRKTFSESNILTGIDSLTVYLGNTLSTIYTNTATNSKVIEMSFFDLSKKNTLSNYNFGLAFLGIASKNLITKLSYKGGETSFYYYTFDNRGRVRSVRCTNDGILIWESAYEYYD